MTLDLDALEQKARAATPGEWLPESTELYEDGESTCLYRALGPACGVEGDPDSCDDAADQAHRDAAFIAAASPDVILALVARVRAAEATIDAHLTADNGETWEAECMRARAQRDAAESRAQRAEAEAQEWEARAELAARLVTDGPYAKDAARLMDLRLRESDLEERAQRAEERLAVAVGALRRISALVCHRYGQTTHECGTCPPCGARAALAEVAAPSRGVVGGGG